jgi:hypothetical protein
MATLTCRLPLCGREADGPTSGDIFHFLFFWGTCSAQALLQTLIVDGAQWQTGGAQRRRISRRLTVLGMRAFKTFGTVSCVASTQLKCTWSRAARVCAGAGWCDLILSLPVFSSGISLGLLLHLSTTHCTMTGDISMNRVALSSRSAPEPSRKLRQRWCVR